MTQSPFTIDLTSEENDFVNAIQFDPRNTLGDTKSFHANGDLVIRLTESLLKRKAIPTQRLNFFSDPDYHVAGRGSSRQELFMRKVRSHEEMVRHGHFLKYLHYFIYGAKLPAPAIQAFKAAVDDCGAITSGDIAPLGTVARHLVRANHLAPKEVADEFYKLCLDLDLDPSDEIGRAHV